jgi:hypothetical protein
VCSPTALTVQSCAGRVFRDRFDVVIQRIHATSVRVTLGREVVLTNAETVCGHPRGARRATAHKCSRAAMGLNGSARCALVGARRAPPASPAAVVIQPRHALGILSSVCPTDPVYAAARPRLTGARDHLVPLRPRLQQIAHVRIPIRLCVHQCLRGSVLHPSGVSKFSPGSRVSSRGDGRIQQVPRCPFSKGARDATLDDSRSVYPRSGLREHRITSDSTVDLRDHGHADAA